MTTNNDHKQETTKSPLHNYNTFHFVQQKIQGSYRSSAAELPDFSSHEMTIMTRIDQSNLHRRLPGRLWFQEP